MKGLVRTVAALAVAACLLPAASANAAGITLFSYDFDGLPTIAPGVGVSTSGSTSSLESVQNYTLAGLGFSGNFLRNTGGGTTQTKSTLTLTNLASHTSVSIGFLLAIIDSWDSVGCCSPDYLNIEVGDGVTQNVVFSQTFDNYNGGAGQSFNTTPAGPRGAYGFNSGFNDAAYDLTNLASLQNIAHTSSTLEISWFASGPGWQGGNDESWAMDNLTVSMDAAPAPVPEPATLSLVGLALAGMAGRRRFGPKRR
jgi:hypothetical protein